jgi:RIO-like serine/threonine protein kinase
MQEMIPFRPHTNHVNEDRRYFLDGNHFVKADSYIGRGQHEADVLTLLETAWYAPTIISAFQKDGFHFIRMTRVPGETLENILTDLDDYEKRAITKQLLKITADLLDRGIVHGDLNVSNILFDRVSGKVHVIDYETAIREESLRDIHGPEWGLMDLLGRLK